MKIRFLRTTASACPDVPFQAGQVIDLPSPTPEQLEWLKPLPDGERLAEVVRDEHDGEVAVKPKLSELGIKLRRRGRRAGVSA